MTGNIRRATLADLDALIALERDCFASDRLSRRSFRHMLTQAHADLVVHVADDDALHGYALLLHHRGTQLGRLYSIAVHPSARGLGSGRALLRAIEAIAVERGCSSIRLEVATGNKAAIALYRDEGFVEIGRFFDYYEDHGDALRMEKSLLALLPAPDSPVPFYAQSTEFTCGPAALLMAMASLDRDFHPDRRSELRIWREATSIFMTSGHGGCGPLGLALAAHHRGFRPEIFASSSEPMFLKTVRSDLKKEVMRIVHDEFSEEIAAAGIPVRTVAVSIAQLRAAMDAGKAALVLVSSSRIYNERFPHWLVIAGIDDQFVFVHDPYIDTDTHKTVTDSINIPIRHDAFVAMTRYGRNAARATLLLEKTDKQ